MLKVLIVDNEAIIRKGLSQCINWQEEGCVISATASDGLEALQCMRQDPADIVISDIRMPKMDGLALACELQKNYPAAKVIILTGYSEFEYAQACVKYRVVDFILKPTSSDKLLSAVRRAKSMLMDEQKHAILEVSLIEKEKDSLAYQQQLFLQNLISEKSISTQYARNHANRLGIDFSSYYIVNCAISSVDSISADKKEKCHQNAIAFLQKIFEKQAIILDSHGKNDFIAVIFHIDKNALIDCLQDYVSMIETLTDYSIRVGVSTEGNNDSSLFLIAKEAQDALTYTALDTRKSFLFFSDIPSLSNSSRDKLTVYLKRIDMSLQKNSFEDFRATILDFESTVHADHIPFSEVSNFILITYNLCLSRMMDFNMNVVFSSGVMPIKQLIEELRPNNITSDILLVGQHVFSALRGMMTEPDGITGYLCNYIQTHYEQNITLESLASEVHLSPSYLSRMFKQYTGENISSYIQKVRIAAACELLKSSSKKTYEIAQAVGIDNPVYFSRLFKKLTGDRPSDYREQYHGKKWSVSCPTDNKK